MKRIISIAVISLMILSALTLTSCSGGGSGDKDYSDSKYVGTWKAVSMELGDASEATDFDFTITINADGTGILSSEGEEDSNFTWEPTSDGFKTTGDMKLTFKDDGDKIVTKLLGVDIVFEKQ